MPERESQVDCAARRMAADSARALVFWLLVLVGSAVREEAKKRVLRAERERTRAMAARGSEGSSKEGGEGRTCIDSERIQIGVELVRSEGEVRRR